VRSSATNGYRLFNGEGDLLPGLVCDVYDSVAVLQFDGRGPGEFWDRKLIAPWILAHTGCRTVVEKVRGEKKLPLVHQGGDEFSGETVALENGAKFKVNIATGQKTGFFLDQRDNRQYVCTVSQGKSVLNLFSYSGGFSIYAGLGGARQVESLDIAAGAIALTNDNWELNGLPPSGHTGLEVDIFEFLKKESKTWDHVIVDPPSMSHSEAQKSAAMAKYIEIFAAAAKRVGRSGQLSLSSCSSHISFKDFFEIITDALSSARRTGQILRVSGQGADHPFPHACHELRYLKFVSLALD
jgi:23S rRNA (cytosine1962-C5)-methyltransferase